jgi:transcriptional regulator with XRE-family HTH domain
MLGERLRQAREKAGMSIYGLARETHVGVATISEIESGKNRNPGIETMARLAKTLRVSLDTLAGLTEAMVPRSRSREKRTSVPTTEPAA